jgi:WD40 repeat protein
MATTTSLVEAVALSGHTDRAWHVSWHPTLDVLASCSGDRTVKLWAPGRGAPSATAWAAWTCVGTLEVGGVGGLLGELRGLYHRLCCRRHPPPPIPMCT